MKSNRSNSLCGAHWRITIISFFKWLYKMPECIMWERKGGRVADPSRQTKMMNSAAATLANPFTWFGPPEIKKNDLETFNNISKAGSIGSKDIRTLNGHPFWFKQHIQLQKHNLIHIIRFKESNLYIKHFSCNIVSKQLKIQYIDRF